MITFKVKDLMIQLPEESERRDVVLCPINTGVVACPPRSYCVLGTCYPQSHFCLNTCAAITPPCWHGTVTYCKNTFPGCGITIDDPYTPVIDTIVDTINQTVIIKTYVEQGGDLATLQAQMRQALASVDEAVRARDEALAPQTAEEIDKVEQQLKAALDELQERKTKLQK